MILTRNLNLAVAFATCGVDVQIDKITPLSIGRSSDQRSGGTLTSFVLGPSAVPYDPAPDTAGLSMEIASQWAGLVYGKPVVFRTGTLKAQLDRDYLAQLHGQLRPLDESEPLHPMLDCIIGLSIREKLRTYMERGTRYRVQVLPDAARALFVEGDQPARQPGLRVTHLGMASALIRLGVPVLDCTGPAGSRQLIMAGHGDVLPGIGSIDGVQLARALASGDLARQCPSHPAVWVMMAIENRDRMLANIQHSRSQLLLHDPGTLAWGRHHRSALIMEGASAATFQSAADHLRAP